MNRIVVLAFVTCLSGQAMGQKFLKKLKDKVNETIENTSVSDLVAGDGLINSQRAKQLEKDTSNYNYIFSQGNRASFFANREGKESLLTTASKNYEDEDGNTVELEVYERAFDANRAGERLVYINQKSANINFAQALGLLTDEASMFRITFDSAVNIASLVNIDTLSIEERYALGKTIANYSILIHSEGRYNLSKDFFEQTIRFFEQEIGEGSVAFASLYNNLAVVLQSKGSFTEAESYFDKALGILKSKERSKSVSYAIVLSNKALLYNEIGQYEEASRTIEEATLLADGELRLKGRDNTSFKINKGLIHYTSGEYAEAERIFRDVIALKERRMAANQTDVGNVKNYLAATLMAQQNFSEVPSLLSDALEIFGKKYSTSHPAYIKAQHNLGKYYLISGDLEKASNVLQKVNTTTLEYFGETHPDYLSSLEDLAVVAWSQGNNSLARARFSEVLQTNLSLVEKYFGAMSEYEKGQYWAKVRPSILKFYAFAVENYASDPSLMTEMFNIHLKTKGILLSASTKVREQILSSNNEPLKRKYREWVEAKERLLLYYSYSKTQLQELEINLLAEEEKANAIEKELNRLSTEFAEANKLPTATIAEVKSKLGGEDVAIEVIGYPVFDKVFKEDKNYAFLVASLDRLNPELVLIKEGSKLDTRYAKGYLNKIKMQMDDNTTYRKFWEPVDQVLAGKENVHLSLDGIYFQVNVGALQRADGSYVSDTYDFHYYTSTRDLIASPSASSQKTATFFGYPDYGSKGLVAPLPGTRDEIASISQITKSRGFNTQTFLQREASEANFKKMSSPSLLHIATHGFFLPESSTSGEKVFGIDVTEADANPLLRSGLMLANAEQAMTSSQQQSTEVTSLNNGILTAYEVMNLDLKNTDMVVMSACETGLGEVKSGEGVYGLQRAFQVAGTETLVMSLWKVSDEATQKLMTSFYQNWMGGMAKEAAFLAAQQKLREAFPEPYYWGAFIMLN